MNTPDTRQAVQAALAMIKAVHTTEVIDQDKVGAWCTLLADLPPNLIVTGTIEALRSSVYPPKPADIRTAAIPKQLASGEAWIEFVEAMREPRQIRDETGELRRTLPSWSNDISREAGEPIAADVCHMIDAGDNDDYHLRTAYCQRYDRLLANAIHAGEWDRLDMGDHVIGRLYLTDGGYVDDPQLATVEARDRLELPRRVDTIAYDEAEVAHKQRLAEAERTGS